MRILCSGGGGFVGSHTADLLAANGHEVMIVDNFSTGKSENLYDFCCRLTGYIRVCDINDMKLLNRCFEEFRPEAVLHLAAQSAITTSQQNPKKDLRVNGLGTLNMLEMAQTYNVGKFVFSSTSAVYRQNYEHLPSFLEDFSESRNRRPDTPYGISKLAAESYVRTRFPNHVVLRYGNIYGPRQTPIGSNQVVARAFDHFMTGAEFKVHGHGNQKRDFVYVGDIARANLAALTSPVTGTFNCASGNSHSVNEILHEIEMLYDIHYRWEHTLQNDPRGNVHMNVSKIKRELGWSAETTLPSGIWKTMEWWENTK